MVHFVVDGVDFKIDDGFIQGSKFFQSMIELTIPHQPIYLQRDHNLFRRVLSFARHPHSCALFMDQDNSEDFRRELDFYDMLSLQDSAYMMDLCVIIRKKNHLLRTLWTERPYIDLETFRSGFASIIQRTDMSLGERNQVATFWVNLAHTGHEQSTPFDQNTLETWFKTMESIDRILSILREKNMLVKDMASCVPTEFWFEDMMETIVLDLSGLDELCIGQGDYLYTHLIVELEKCVYNTRHFLDVWKISKDTYELFDMFSWLKDPADMQIRNLTEE